MNAEERSHKTSGSRYTKPPSMPSSPGASGGKSLAAGTPPGLWMITVASVVVGILALMCLVGLTVTVLRLSARTADKPTAVSDQAAEPFAGLFADEVNGLSELGSEEVAEPARPVMGREPAPRSVAVGRLPGLADTGEPESGLSGSYRRRPSVSRVELDEEGTSGASSRAAAAAEPFSFPEGQAAGLPLPPLLVADASGPLARQRVNREPLALLSLEADDPTVYRLELVGDELAGHDVQIAVGDDAGSRRWEIEVHAKTALGASVLFHVATFALRDNTLWFNWEAEQPPFRMFLCGLQLTREAQTRVYHFQFPVQTGEPAPLLNPAGSRFLLATFDGQPLRAEDAVGLELQFHGPTVRPGSEETLRINWQEPRGRVPVSGPPSSSDSSEAGIWLEVRLVSEPSRGRLELETQFVGQTWSFSETPPRPRLRGRNTYQLAHWKRERTTIAPLTEERVRQHWDEVFGTLEPWLGASEMHARSSGFEHLEDWVNAPAEMRRAALEFARYHNGLEEDPRKPPAAGSDESGGSRDRFSRAEGSQSIRSGASYFYDRYDLEGNHEVAALFHFLLDTREQVARWAHTTTRHLQRVDQELLWEYRLYLEREDRELDLITSRGFSGL